MRGPSERGREPATYGTAIGNDGRFAGWALTTSGRMIWTQWRRERRLARRELERKAARAGVVLRWLDVPAPEGLHLEDRFRWTESKALALRDLTMRIEEVETG